jgi:hypothetical protein
VIGVEERQRYRPTALAAKALGLITRLRGDPDRSGDVLADKLAHAIHERYLADQLAAGRLMGETASMEHWEELPPEFRRSLHAYAKDVGCKLADIGCLLTHQAEPFRFQASEIEHLAESEHVRWSAERTAVGWRFGPSRDDAARTHPSLVPWAQLSEAEKERDREAVRALPELLADAGLVVVRLDREVGHMTRSQRIRKRRR